MKNTAMGKCSRKAATVYNKQFGAMAGVARWKVFTNSELSDSWQVQVARHCAKLPARWLQCGATVQSDNETEN